ncbi:MAG: ATP-dependent DNA helicase [Lachnospiraceae bacterium]
MEKEVIAISVRDFIEFIFRSGDIDNRRKRYIENAMQEGSKIHRMIQRRMGSNYKAEVGLTQTFDMNEFEIKVHGRADGIIDIEQNVTIDEIKGTYKELKHIKEPIKEHLYQAMCYAYLYARNKKIEEIKIQLTYCNLETEEIKYFHETFFLIDLEQWFMEALFCYKKWCRFKLEWKRNRDRTLLEFELPFSYRKGQKELITHIYHSIWHKSKLFLHAPTGIGKTISTIFPAMKSMGKGHVNKIFYFTSKTITREVAKDTFLLLENKGVDFKSIVLTAKEKICFLAKVDCNPISCRYALGHYDRVNDCIFELINNENTITRKEIIEYALKYTVCPFELELDVSIFCDGIIGDYNYLFDPHARLKRFFAEGIKEKYCFLIDEAHNLVERGREMYSAFICKEELVTYMNKIKKYHHEKLNRRFEAVNKQLLYIKKDCESVLVLNDIRSLVQAMGSLESAIKEILEIEKEGTIVEEILEFYFLISHFLLIYERIDDHYIIYAQREEESFFVYLFCVDPTSWIEECLNLGVASILFSATLLPINYYKSMLGGSEEDYTITSDSVFDEKKKKVFIATDITSIYEYRNEELFIQYADYIEEIMRAKNGNYFVFFPSYQLLESVYEAFIRKQRKKIYSIVKQNRNMKEQEKEEFLRRFREENNLLGFCVLGGIYGEGIDLKGESLIGVIIVGAGLPQISVRKELMKNYFDKVKENQGFQYAYQYPAINNVLQAAGRVIRTMEDKGIIVLLDYRFTNNGYKSLFPKDWSQISNVTINNIKNSILKFWET